MKRFVIDASVAVKWFLPDAADEADVPAAVGLLLQLGAEDVAFVQPAHWKAEVAAVLARRAPETATLCIEDLNLLAGIDILDSAPIYRRAVDLARRLQHHLFDTLYHAVALEADAPMVTADRRYYDKARHLGHIRLLGQFEPQARGVR